MLGIAIRYAELGDAEAIADLVERSPGEVAALFDRGEFLVLDRPRGGLAGSLFIRVEERRARLDLLSVAPGGDRELERRLLEVAEMLSQARGLRALELRFSPRGGLRTLCQEMGFETTPEPGGDVTMAKLIAP